VKALWQRALPATSASRPQRGDQKTGRRVAGQPFERNNEITVTPLGEDHRQAQSVLEQTEGIRDIAKRGKDPLAGPLRLASSTIAYLLPDLVRQAIRLTPQMPLMLQNFTVKLKSCAMARSTARFWPNPSPTPTWPLHRSMTSPSWRPCPVCWHARGSVTAEEMKRNHAARQRPLLSRPCAGGLPRVRPFSSSSEGIRKSFEGSSLETIKHMVAAGMGITWCHAWRAKESLAAPASGKEGRARGSNLRTSSTCRSKATSRAGGGAGGGAVTGMRPSRCWNAIITASCRR
jgi:LysR family hydrogen peroxide-inducible transcriptional activator